MTGHLPEVSLLEAALDDEPSTSLHPEVAAHLRACKSCLTRLQELREDLTQLVSRDETPPPPRLRAHLLAAVNLDAVQPFAGLSRRVARIFDLDEAQVQKVLRDAHGDSAWEVRGPFSYFHFTPGPKLAPTAEAGIVRLEPGVSFPRHRHRGDEYALVLRGALREDTGGSVAFPGDIQHMPEDSRHTVTCTSREPCVFAVLLYGGSPDIEAT